MPWVRLDDRFPSHRKVALLSDRAFRLYVAALCWSSENLTEGRISDRELPHVARLRGIKTAAKELEDARLWDRAGDGWDIHDFLEYNPDRARVQADREANAARQKAWRERKRAEREAKRAAEEAARNADRNGVTQDSENASSNTTATGQRHDSDTTTTRTDQTKQQSSQVSEFRNGVSNAAPSPSPSHSVLPSEVPPPPSPSTQPAGRNAVEVSGRGEIQPLIEAMGARGMTVSWTFHSNEWMELRNAVRRVGVPALVEHAARVWQASKTTPYSARYFLAGWTGLQEAPAYTGPRPVDGPSKTQEYLEDMAAIAEELRQQKKGTA